MADVQALDLDVVTEKSNHQVVGMAVSVCLTPAAPAPLPIPYPTVAMVADGISDSPLRTKVSGTNCATIGSVLKTCHGNEPGTLKEVVSLNNTGPVAPITGAFTVLIELGAAATTGSICDMNKAPTPGAGSSASGAGGAGGGGGSGSGSAGASPGMAGPSGPSGGGSAAGGSASGATALKGVSQKELDDAARPGNTKAQIKAREKVAKRFYKQQGGMTAAEARGHMRGIDTDKPLTIGPPPPCPTPQGQWQAPGSRQGQYYADAGTTPTSLGIHDQGATMGPGGWGTGPVVPKNNNSYNVAPNTPYMQSTAAPVKDTWSAPGHSYGTDGGATQRYIPGQSGGATPASTPPPAS